MTSSDKIKASRMNVRIVTGKAMIECLTSARGMLYFLSWSGFMVNFLQITDINIAIITMMKPLPKDQTDCCYTEKLEVISSEAGRFQWSMFDQSCLIGSFYWTYCLSQLVSIWATDKFGTKMVFGLSQLFVSLAKFVFPTACNFHLGTAIGTRCLEGFLSGLTWPSLFAIMPKWIPVQEREYFSTSIHGCCIGVGLSFCCYGWLLANMNWPMVFYSSGVLGVTWCAFWFVLVSDCPSRHPFISGKELAYISGNIEVTEKQARHIPWHLMMTSIPVWAAAVSTFGRVAVTFLYIQYCPMYITHILGIRLTMAGFLSGAPFLVAFATSNLCRAFINSVENWDLWSLTCTRRLLAFLGQVVAGIVVIAINYTGCNWRLHYGLIFLVVQMTSALTHCSLSVYMDLAPNFYAPTIAFAQTLQMSGAAVVSLIVAKYSAEGHTLEGWHSIHYWMGGIGITTYLAYLFGGTSEVQDWNYYGEEVDPEVVEAEQQASQRQLNLIMDTWEDPDMVKLIGKKKKKRKIVREYLDTSADVIGIISDVAENISRTNIEEDESRAGEKRKGRKPKKNGNATQKSGNRSDQGSSRS